MYVRMYVCLSTSVNKMGGGFGDEGTRKLRENLLKVVSI